MKCREIRKYFIENDFEITEHTDTLGKVMITAEPINPGIPTIRTKWMETRIDAFNSLLHKALGLLKNNKNQ